MRVKTHVFTLKAKNNNKKNNKSPSTINKPIYVEKWKLIVTIIIELMTLFLLIRTIRLFSSGSLNQVIFYWRYHTAHTDSELALPKYLSLIRKFCTSSGYIWIYVLIHGIVFKYKNNRILLGINIILCILDDIILGARTGIINYLVAMIVYVYFMYQYKNNWKFQIKPKTMIRTVGIIVLFVLLFQTSARMLGRNSTVKMDEYIAIYLSAELKNLDLFITREPMGLGNSLFTTKTFTSLVNGISGKFGLPVYYHRLVNPYRSVNGRTLGNVSTTFYAFLYDGGYFQLVICTVFMAIVGQIVYMRIIKKGNTSKQFDLFLLAYGYLFFTYLFCFFSNKFYEMIISPSFLRMLLFWWLLIFFIKLKVKKIGS